MHDGGTWSSTVTQTILADCRKKKRETGISDDAFELTAPREFLPVARVARECDSTARPNVADRKYPRAARKRSGKSKTTTAQRIGRRMRNTRNCDASSPTLLFSGSENRIIRAEISVCPARPVFLEIIFRMRREKINWKKKKKKTWRYFALRSERVQTDFERWLKKDS